MRYCRRRKDTDVKGSSQESFKELVSKETINIASRLERFKWQPGSKGRLHIPLCRMISLHVVRPYVKNDVLNLASHFTKCMYMEGNGYFYVAIENNHGVSVDVSDSIKAKWSAEWINVNDELERMLQEDEDIKIFSLKRFQMWKGNHRLQAWMPIIDQEHFGDIDWHYSVESLILDSNGDIPSILTALHEVN
ncbi:hypothetical protein M758_UG129100 [Ceratodon purpureus]|nr:hypothetical protein M758_UG129100 [Ceratodon purpureus]KAG0594989.1 hypothetical protein M758_UG129100 [Ceratodon purpureus]KAG0594990.1 hypothetical protein M758_UG129100 [Ceratodon purpureus]KAG0594991.1 hypothetical protein M758_UG129100 [Ceratodon purpureus]